MNRFQAMFNHYNDKIQSLSGSNPKFGKMSKRLSALESFGISSEDEALLVSYLKKRLNLYTGGEDGELSLIGALDFAYPSKRRLILLLRQLAKAANEADRARLLALIDALAQGATQLETPQEVDEVAYESLSNPFKGAVLTPQERKLYDLGLFAYNKAKDSAYFPTAPVEIGATRFDGDSRAQLCDRFAAENFYKLSKAEILELLQATANEYLLSNGVEPCAVTFKPMTLGKNIQFGEYSPNAGQIILNSAVLDMLDEAKDEGNKAFPYQLLSTVIHEATHRIQFSKMDKEGLEAKDAIVTGALETPQDSLSFSAYLSSADELDARNEALRYIREAAMETGSESLMGYYNVRKKNEINNGKLAIAESMHSYFEDIYDGKMLATQVSLEAENAKLYRMLTSIRSVREPGQA